MMSSINSTASAAEASPPPALISSVGHWKPLKNSLLSLLRVILAIIFPPLAVLDCGCGSILIVTILTLCGWVPGIIAALIILNKNK